MLGLIVSLLRFFSPICSQGDAVPTSQRMFLHPNKVFGMCSSPTVLGFPTMRDHTLILFYWKNCLIDWCDILSAVPELRGGGEQRGTRDLPDGEAPSHNQARRGDLQDVSVHKPFPECSLLVLFLLDLIWGSGIRGGIRATPATPKQRASYQVAPCLQMVPCYARQVGQGQ